MAAAMSGPNAKGAPVHSESAQREVVARCGDCACMGDAAVSDQVKAPCIEQRPQLDLTIYAELRLAPAMCMTGWGLLRNEDEPVAAIQDAFANLGELAPKRPSYSCLCSNIRTGLYHPASRINEARSSSSSPYLTVNFAVAELVSEPETPMNVMV